MSEVEETKTTKVTIGGEGFLVLLFLLFLGLKLGNVISWSWWWVFAPLWIPLALGVLVLLLTALVVVVEGFIKGKSKKQ